MHGSIQVESCWLLIPGLYLKCCFAILRNMAKQGCNKDDTLPSVRGSQVLPVSAPTHSFSSHFCIQNQCNQILLYSFSRHFYFLLDLKSNRHSWGRAEAAEHDSGLLRRLLKGSRWLISLVVLPLQYNVKGRQWIRLVRLSSIVWVAIRWVSAHKAKYLCSRFIFLTPILLNLLRIGIFFISFWWWHLFFTFCILLWQCLMLN